MRHLCVRPRNSEPMQFTTIHNAAKLQSAYIRMSAPSLPFLTDGDIPKQRPALSELLNQRLLSPFFLRSAPAKSCCATTDARPGPLLSARLLLIIKLKYDIIVGHHWIILIIHLVPVRDHHKLIIGISTLCFQY